MSHDYCLNPVIIKLCGIKDLSCRNFSALTLPVPCLVFKYVCRYCYFFLYHFFVPIAWWWNPGSTKSTAVLVRGYRAMSFFVNLTWSAITKLSLIWFSIALVVFLSLGGNISRKSMKKILKIHLNCHIVHPHVTSTYEKVQFNESRSAAYILYVIDHQHCSRNLVLTWEDSFQPHHLWRMCYIFWAGGGGEGALSRHLISFWGFPFQVKESKTTSVLHL